MDSNGTTAVSFSTESHSMAASYRSTFLPSNMAPHATQTPPSLQTNFSSRYSTPILRVVMENGLNLSLRAEKKKATFIHRAPQTRSAPPVKQFHTQPRKGPQTNTQLKKHKKTRQNRRSRIKAPKKRRPENPDAPTTTQKGERGYQPNL